MNETKSPIVKHGAAIAWRALLSVCAVAAILSACGRTSSSANPVAEEPAATDISNGAPAMWRLADDDSEIFLFGTFHILPAGASFVTDAFDAAMDTTEITVTEVDTKSPEAQAKMSALVQKLGLNPPGVTLSAQLGPKRAAALAATSARYGVSMAALEPLKPWLAMITLSIAIMQEEGYSAEAGAEELILKRAKTQNDTVEHFESAEFQIRALASLDEEEMLADFDASLEQFGDFKAYADRLLKAWLTGDVDALDMETLAEMRENAPGAFKILIADRNRDWAAKIARYMAADGDYFIAVGAGHLVGDDSVIDLLQQQGFTVDRVQ